MNIQFLKSGNKIKIKKKNQGKFTDYCGGKVTQECINKAKSSGNNKLIKRAVFAENARKWKHQYGGSINGAPNKYQTNNRGDQLPSQKKEELIKFNQKKYPGITRAQAAGEAPINYNHHNYYLNKNSELIPIKRDLRKKYRKHNPKRYQQGGKTNSYLQAGINVATNIVGAIGNIAAGKDFAEARKNEEKAIIQKSLSEKAKAIEQKNKELQEKLKGYNVQLAGANNSDFFNSQEQAFNSKAQELNQQGLQTQNKFSGIAKGFNNLANSMLQYKIEKNQAQDLQNSLNTNSAIESRQGAQKQSTILPSEKETPIPSKIDLPQFGKQTFTKENTIPLPQENISIPSKINLISSINNIYEDPVYQQMNQKMNDIDNQMYGFSGEDSDYDKLSLERDTLQQKMNEFTKKFNAENSLITSKNGSPLKSKDGGKVFSNYHNPADDTGIVNSKTKKLIKRKGIKYGII